MRPLLILTIAMFPFLSSWAGTLADVRARGAVRCGVAEDHPGFGMRDPSGSFVGFEADFCRALAAAVLGDAERASFISLNARQRFDALLAREVDVLVRSTTGTLGRDAGMPFNFAGNLFFDVQTIMSRRERRPPAGMPPAGRICTVENTTTAESAGELARRHPATMTTQSFRSWQGMAHAFFRGECDFLSETSTDLEILRQSLADDASRYVVWDDPKFELGREHSGPLVRNDDDRWFDIVKWTLQALVLAEAKGVGRINAEAIRKSATDPETRRLLGVEGGLGKALSLADDWAFQAIRQVGNYGEIFERHLGAGSPLKRPRGPNRLWRDGGLHYPMLFR